MARSQRHRLEQQGKMSDGRELPRTTARPTFSGTNTVGSTQTGVNSTFTGSGTVTVTRAWVRDNAEIAGQTGATYVQAGARTPARLCGSATRRLTSWGRRPSTACPGRVGNPTG
jgi:alpha-D-ribose 1-methylphosphonate 5-triphosphate synthase subunit PhnG